jgi:carbamate kinase
VTSESSKTRIMVALGGNAILKHTEEGTAMDQLRNVRATSKVLVELVRKGYQLAITHGNGPQVGDILLKNDIAKSSLPPMPLDICSSESQGMIGYMLQQSMYSELHLAGLDSTIATIVTQTVVDSDDPAFVHPTKPIGPFYTALEASKLRNEKGWTIVDDSGRGFRRVVPSPQPIRFVEEAAIKTLFENGVMIIASGGGGVPVIIKEDGTISGVEGVIDKDRASVILANTLSADILLILTDVMNAYVDYNRPNQSPIYDISIEEAKKLADDGQFAEGSMAPKVESAIRFVEEGGKSAIITSMDNVFQALAGQGGTVISK